MSQNKQEWISRGKDAAPEETVEKILALLDKAGIETEYFEYPPSIESCYSSQVSIKGPLGLYIKANGKGLSPSLCKASAYGELMERLQNIMFSCSPETSNPRFHELEETISGGYYYIRGEEQPDCIKRLKEKLIHSVPKTTPLFMREELIDSLLEEIIPAAEKGKLALFPFYSLREKKYVYLPKMFILSFTLSNGMAAGNTLEEAIVQAASEIFERYSEFFFVQGKCTPPDIPEEVIRQYPSVSRIIDNIQADGRYKVTVKDCSMGKGLPVVCGIISDTRRQTFGIKFGAHPDMCIALERVFSESLQGTTLEQFTKNGRPLFNTDSSRVNTWNLIKTANGDFPVNLLTHKADYPFKEWPSVKGLTNRQIMKGMLSLMADLGSDVYIHDVSFLGFPTVMIYAAGLTEALPVDILQLKELKLNNDVQKIFHKEGPFTKEEIKKIGLLGLLKRNSTLENRYELLTGMYVGEKRPGYPYESIFLEAVCSYALGDVHKAIDLLSHLVSYHLAQDENETILYFRTLLLAMKGIAAGMDHAELVSILNKMSSSHVVEKVLSDLGEDAVSMPERVFCHCPGFHCESCHVEGCLNSQILDFFLVLARLRDKNTVDPQILENLLTQMEKD